ncbi:10426_t:CDS:2 [Funneliformis caledonium]|uniref:10426_t:CDS:1 n=1 Tax=Funneliformis caledonium TaxID=1117310 RepID=A0A9N9HMF8_9GLOM|nr:10426_t:CDS:2 [Funneliformis caledonium]
MGIKQSKHNSTTIVSNIKDKPDVLLKTEKRKKFRSWRSSGITDVNSLESWRFSHGGKRIHNLKSTKLIGPIIDEEVERLQRQHRLFKRIWQNNYSAPIEEKLKDGGARVLDVGCGPGTWTIEMAESYPKTLFTGVDFAPIFPQEKKPENAKFLQANILDGLPFLDDTFDFVHMRLLVTAFSSKEWEEKIIPELVRVTRQGGWVEFMESDIQYYNDGPITQRLTNALMTFMKAKGIFQPINSHIPDSMEANDKFVSGIKVEEKACFVGKWAGELGQLAVDDITKGWNAVRLPMSIVMGTKANEYDEIIQTFAKEVEQHKTYFKTWRFFGQKVTTNSSFAISTPSWAQSVNNE